jgi:ribosomal protein L18E
MTFVVDNVGLIFVCSLIILVVASVGAWSSLTNRRRMAHLEAQNKEIIEQNKLLAQQIEHNTRNQKQVKLALEAREAKEDARNAVPIDVTIVNQTAEPVPVHAVAPRDPP